MTFEEERMYRFAVLNKKGKEHQYRNGFKRVYLRREGNLELFTSAVAGWLETFTPEQLADFDIQEVRA